MPKSKFERHAIVSAKRLFVNRSEVTASAAELNGLAGAGLSSAMLTLLAQGVAAGYKIARGVTTITAASQTIVTGLATVVSAVVSPTTDPTLTDMWKAVTVGDQAGTPAAGSIIVTSTKPTATGNVTPIAATTPWRVVAWIAIGT